MYITLCALSRFKDVKTVVLKECDSTPIVQMKVMNKTDLQFSKFHGETIINNIMIEENNFWWFVKGVQLSRFVENVKIIKN